MSVTRASRQREKDPDESVGGTQAEPTWCLTPKDGQRFLMVKRLNADEKGRPSLTVVTHWFDVLRVAMKGT